MKLRTLVLVAAGTAALQGCAVTYRITPIESPPATVRYDRGSGTANLVQRYGGVQVTPMGIDNGKLIFGVAVANSSDRPANFGVENIEMLSPDNKLLHVYSADDLVREERNKATAESIAIAAAGVAGTAASIAASDQHYHETYHTPHGTYRYSEHYHDPGVAVAGSALSLGAAGAGIYAVQRSLDTTIAGIGNSVLQTTTVDPGRSIGGRVFIRKPLNREYPQTVTMRVSWNGENYEFRFQITAQS